MHTGGLYMSGYQLWRPKQKLQAPDGQVNGGHTFRCSSICRNVFCRRVRIICTLPLSAGLVFLFFGGLPHNQRGTHRNIDIVTRTVSVRIYW